MFTLIPRPAYLQRIHQFRDTDIVKVLTGIRRCGKSTILSLVADELRAEGIPEANIIQMNMESGSLAEAASSSRALYQEALRRSAMAEGRVYFFLDEVQEVPGWERTVNALRVDLDCDIYLTGSNAHLLSSELATLLTGRYISMPVYPLSFREIVDAYPGKTPQELFTTYRTLGGMPFLASIAFSRTESLSYLSDVMSSIVLRDIVSRHDFRNTEQLDRLIRYFISETGTTFSAKNLINTLREEGFEISRQTLYTYIDAAVEAQLISRVPRFDVRGKKLLRTSEKTYVTDIGFREALFGNNGARIDIVLEDIVYIELMRRGYSVCIGRNAQQEIDFIAEQNGSRIYVQVAYLLASADTIEREFGAFRGIDDGYPRYVVTMDEIDFSQNGIRHMNIRDFLLADDLS